MAPAGVVLELPSTMNIDDAQWVRRGLPLAQTRCAAFGLPFPKSVLIALHDDVRTFIQATGQDSHWLRAYAQYRRADFLTPDMWRDASVRTRHAKLVHELWHVAMFQSFTSEKQAAAARIPLWFREGSASVVADQAFARVPRAQFRDALRDRGINDPLRESVNQKLTYAASHYAAEALVGRNGPGAFAQLVAHTKTYLDAPHPFESALTAVTGAPPSQFWGAVVVPTFR